MKNESSNCLHEFIPWVNHINFYYKFRFCTRCRFRQLVIRPGVYRIWKNRELIKMHEDTTIDIAMGRDSDCVFFCGPRGMLNGITAAGYNHLTYRFKTAELIAIIDDFEGIMRAEMLDKNVEFRPEIEKLVGE